MDLLRLGKQRPSVHTVLLANEIRSPEPGEGQDLVQNLACVKLGGSKKSFPLQTPFLSLKIFKFKIFQKLSTASFREFFKSLLKTQEFDNKTSISRSLGCWIFDGMKRGHQSTCWNRLGEPRNPNNNENREHNQNHNQNQCQRHQIVHVVHWCAIIQHGLKMRSPHAILK